MREDGKICYRYGGEFGEDYHSANFCMDGLLASDSTPTPGFYAYAKAIEPLHVHALDARGIAYDVTPGVSSFCASAAAIPAEFTLPGQSQTVIITRMAGRTPVPERESLERLASHGASMAIFLSAGMQEQVQAALLKGGAYTEDTPAAIVYKATWPEEKIVRCTVGDLAQAGDAAGIWKTAIILVGGFLGQGYERRKLYDPGFTTEYRQGTDTVSQGG